MAQDYTSPQRLRADSTFVGAAPTLFTMSIWGYVDTNQEVNLWNIFDEDAATNMAQYSVNLTPSRAASWRTEGVTPNAYVESGNTVGLNTWVHVCLRVNSASDVDIILQGDIGNLGNSTTTVNPSALDDTALGGRRVNGPAFNDPMEGRIAEFSIWDVALGDDEIVALSDGVTPLRIRPQSLQAYAPCYGISPEPTYGQAGGVDFVLNQSLVIADHVYVAPPFAYGMGWQGAFTAAAVSGRIMSSLAKSGGLASYGGIAGAGGGLAG